MAVLRDTVGHKGLISDGDWILSEDMSLNGTIGVIQLKHVGVGEFLDKDFNFISEQTFKRLRCTEVLSGDVLISRMADPIGRACIVPQMPFHCVTAVDVTILRVDSDVASANYVQHLCNSHFMRRQIERAIRGTTRPRITRTELETIEIPLPSLPEQRRIASLLDKADRLRRTRRYAAQLSDTFLQAVFVRMFGDPRTNPMGWEVEQVGDHIDSIRYGTGSPPDYQDNGIPFIRATNIKGGTIQPEGVVFISQSDAEKISKCRVKKGNLIIVRSGVNAGDCAIVPNVYDGAFAAYDLIVELPYPTNVYYNHLINSAYGKAIIEPMTRRAGQPHLNAEQTQELRFPLPPLPLRQKFARIVQQFERLGAQQQEAERQAEHLFQTLLQRAFRRGL